MRENLVKSSKNMGVVLGAGALCGSIWGLVESGLVIRHAGYMRHALWNTSICTACRYANLKAMLVCGVILIAWALASMVLWARLRGQTAAAALVVAALGATVAAHEGTRVWLPNGGTTLERPVFCFEFWQSLAAFLTCMAGVSLIAGIRRRSLVFGKQTLSTARACGRCGVTGGIRWDCLRRVTPAFLVPLLVLNLIVRIYQFQNTRRMARRPNIILIMVDTLRADHVGCYGYDTYGRSTTPNVDALAAGGLRFERAISAAPWTTASVSAFMTGRQLRMSLEKGLIRCPDNAVLMSESLKDAGYRTTAVVSNGFVNREKNLARGFDSFMSLPGRGVDGRCSQDVTDAGMRALQEMKKGKFFLFLLYVDPHSPYVLDKDHDYYPGYADRQRDYVPFTFGPGGSRVPGHYEISVPDVTLSEPAGKKRLRWMRALYDSDISFTDKNVGRLIQGVKDLGLYDDTLIVFLSDHGEQFQEHGGLGHGAVIYNECLSVPLIIKLPGQKRPRAIAGTFDLLDIFPTIAKYIGVNYERLDMQGQAVPLSRLTILRDRFIYSYTDFGPIRADTVQNGYFKLTRNLATGEEKLFDLRADCGERFNVLKTRTEIAARMRNALAQKNRSVDENIGLLGGVKAQELTVQERNDLRALGYGQ